MIFLRERLRRLQAAAIFLAGTAVAYLTFDYGSFPWIALTLAFSFAFYGLVHKMVAISPVSGLTIEMLLLCGPASAYLIYLNGEGTGAFLHRGLGTDLLLAATALFTGVAPPPFHSRGEAAAPVHRGIPSIHRPQRLLPVGRVLLS